MAQSFSHTINSRVNCTQDQQQSNLPRLHLQQMFHHENGMLLCGWTRQRNGDRDLTLSRGQLFRFQRCCDASGGFKGIITNMLLASKAYAN